MSGARAGSRAGAAGVARSSVPSPEPSPESSSTPGTAGGAVVPAPRGRERFVARAATATAVLTGLGAAAGLLRDQIVASLFGADGATDAFLVSWTLPEVAATLLIDEAMALVLVPAFSLALARGGRRGVRDLLRATFPRLLLVLACAAAVCAAAAPLLVGALAPGLPDPGLAVDCTRLTAVTLLTFGAAGYASAVLRAHRCFLPPAAVYLACNAGIVGTALALHGPWGVRAAAAGVAVGGLLMVLVQLPSVLRRTRRPAGPAPAPRGPAGPGGRALLVVAGPVALFALARQAQVLVERFLASGLPPGAISCLNYAQKVAQMPMVLALMICTVTLPLVARALADGDLERARRRVERDLVAAGVVVLLGAAYVVAYAPQIIHLLFQRGAFDAGATAATAAVMRVYALGLLGHALVGALVRPFFASGRPVWFPAAAMLPGLLVTAAGGLAAVGPFGAPGIAAANAAGITLTAFLLLRGLAARAVPVDTGRLLGRFARLAGAAALAAAAGWASAPSGASPLPALALGCVVVPAVFAAGLRLSGVPVVPPVASLLTRVRIPERRSHHVRGKARETARGKVGGKPRETEAG
ncbi:lipid II flippase MurJ [Streptomyces marincola]|uniref:Virulence factor MviN n=1 Tax=Streptomyces marincola TaxID=2878388 RepID=A0A1W7D5M4_9ACTN|nr:lipid II flippase MurJ [Streptomyces marincola]ARQ72336.1 virulence factor MviN [Streptomyces marincola]